MESCHRERSNPSGDNGSMDCFVAFAPRNDVDSAAASKTVVPPRMRGSSTPRLLGSIIGFSGILDRPVKPGDDSWVCVCVLAAQCARGFQDHFAPLLIRGCEECRIRTAPAAIRSRWASLPPSACARWATADRALYRSCRPFPKPVPLDLLQSPGCHPGLDIVHRNITARIGA